MALLRMLENHFQRGDLSASSDLGEVMRGSHPDGLQPIPRPTYLSGLLEPEPISPPSVYRPTYLSGLLEPGVSPGFSLKEYIQQLPQGPNPAFVQPTPPSVLNPAFIQPTFMQPIPPPIWSSLSPLRRRSLRIRELLRGFGRSG